MNYQEQIKILFEEVQKQQVAMQYVNGREEKIVRYQFMVLKLLELVNIQGALINSLEQKQVVNKSTKNNKVPAPSTEGKINRGGKSEGPVFPRPEINPPGQKLKTSKSEQ